MAKLKLDATIGDLVTKLERVKGHLGTVQDAYDDLEDTSKKVFKSSADDVDKLTKSVNKNAGAVKDQQDLIKKTEAYLKRLEKAQAKASDPRLIKKYNTEIVKTKAALKSMGNTGTKGLSAINKGVVSSEVVFNGLRRTIQSALLPLLAAGTAVEGIRAIVSTVAEFEQASADLQAITGASGDTFEYLKQQAVEAGVETTASAQETIQAYSLIASAKPELLSNAEALTQITRSAITLSEAMGADLPTAAENLTDIMNQMGASADETDRFINALAAGAKEGSAEIGQLAAAFVVTGVEMRASNVQLEEGVGLIEVLAEKGIKGAEAGTKMRNVFSTLSATELLPKDAQKRLEAAGVDIAKLSDKTLTFKERLELLKPVQNDANALTAVFGLENKSVAKILIDNTDRLGELTEAVTGTNTALDQSAIRTRTIGGEWRRLKNTIQAVTTESGSSITGIVTFILSFFRSIVLGVREYLNEIAPYFSFLSDSLSALGKSLSGLFGEVGRGAPVMQFFKEALRLSLVPLKVLVTVAGTLVQVLGAVIKYISGAASRFGFLRSALSAVGSAVYSVVTGFANLPKYVAGGLAAVGEFISATLSGIGDLGSQVATLFSEMFNIRKIIQFGTGGLKKALGDLFVNPFKDVGKRTKQAFNEGFNSIEFDSPLKPDAGKLDSKTGGASGGTGGKVSSGVVEEAKNTEKLRVQAMLEGKEKALALEDLRHKDLITKLNKAGLETADAEKQHLLNRFRINQKYLKDVADLEQLSGEERIKYVYDATLKEVDALEKALKDTSVGKLTEAQTKQIALLRKKAADQYLKDLEAISDRTIKAEQQREQYLLDLKRKDFDSEKAFQEFKERELLRIKLKYARKQLEITEKLRGADSDQALALKAAISNVEAALKSIEEGKTADKFSFYSLIGLDPNTPEGKKAIEGVKVAAQTAADVFTQINDIRLASVEDTITAQDKKIESIDSEIKAKEKQLEVEESLAAKGLANNENAIRKEIAILKKQKAQEAKVRKEAADKKKKIEKEQLLINSLAQVSNLLTASTKIFDSVSAIPVVGVPLAIGLISTMFGAFAAAKVRAYNAIDKAEKGRQDYVKGRRHSDGGELFEVESGEAYGVLSRGVSRRYGADFIEISKQLNAGRALPDIIEELSSGPRRTLTTAKVREHSQSISMDRVEQLLEHIIEASKDKSDERHYIPVSTPGGPVVLVKDHKGRTIKTINVQV